MDKTGEEANGLMIKIDELNLFNEKSDQELKKAKAIKQVQYFVFFLIQGTICVLWRLFVSWCYIISITNP